MSRTTSTINSECDSVRNPRRTPTSRWASSCQAPTSRRPTTATGPSPAASATLAPWATIRPRPPRSSFPRAPMTTPPRRRPLPTFPTTSSATSAPVSSTSCLDFEDVRGARITTGRAFPVARPGTSSTSRRRFAAFGTTRMWCLATRTASSPSDARVPALCRHSSERRVTPRSTRPTSSPSVRSSRMTTAGQSPTPLRVPCAGVRTLRSTRQTRRTNG